MTTLLKITVPIDPHNAPLLRSLHPPAPQHRHILNSIRRRQYRRLRFRLQSIGTCPLTSSTPPLLSFGKEDDTGQIQHFVPDDKLKNFRLPVSWQYFVNNVLGASLAATKLPTYDLLVQGCLGTRATCVIDLLVEGCNKPGNLASSLDAGAKMRKVQPLITLQPINTRPKTFRRPQVTRHYTHKINNNLLHNQTRLQQPQLRRLLAHLTQIMRRGRISAAETLDCVAYGIVPARREN
ncbi:hypothetical protein BJ878DRAFT_577381 [Calycina marina]|uniref:Uncharacterized protein n=1 Tax=Calycina marina TaxID=1763456 RepID=A0A9P7YZ44_9HELO|nr:hypothetical protein BJ878DRAFT_577381 [Calycina marina]